MQAAFSLTAAGQAGNKVREPCREGMMEFPALPIEALEDTPEDIESQWKMRYQHLGMVMKLRLSERELQGKTKEELIELLETTPGGASLRSLTRSIFEGRIQPEVWEKAEEIVWGLVGLIGQSYLDDDKTAADKVQAIQKILTADIYNVPQELIRELANCDKQPVSVSRGLAIIQIMGALMSHVELVDPSSTVTRGRIRLRQHVHHEQDPEHLIVARRLSQLSAKATLKALAIRIYLEQQHAEDRVEISENSLSADVKEARKWVRNKYGADPIGDHAIRVVSPSFAWKTRVEKRGGKR